MNNRIDIVIVTYNRLEKLKYTLECYENQTARFRNLIVVNNHCTDGTPLFLEKWKEEEADYNKYVLTMNDNLGGAGGFYEGQKFAMSLNPDWILLADDDAYPEQDMIRNFYTFIDKNKNSLKNVAALCTSVYYPNDEICYSHRCSLKIKYGLRFVMEQIPKLYYKRNFFDVDFFTYVGAIIKVDTLKKIGYDLPQYFIYFDDSEHCMRIRKCGRILCVPQLKIIHDSGWEEVKSDIKEVASWRTYYSTRNRIHMLKLHYFLPALFSTFTRSFSAIKNRDYNWQCRKMVFTAIKDAWFNQLGKHPIYKPGWNVTKKIK